MIRFLQFFILFLIVLFVGVAITWNSVPGWLSNKLSEKAGVQVSIGDISISPWSVGVDRFRIGNPPRSILPYAFAVQKVHADVPLTQFLKKDVVINEMTLNDIYLGIELESMQSKRGNWDTIVRNLNRNSDSSAQSDRTVNIKKLILYNLQIELVFLNDRKVRQLKPIKRLEFTNVGSKGGLPIEQITKIIMDQLMKDIIQKKLQQLLKDVLDQPSKVLNPIKGLFGAVEEPIDEAISIIIDENELATYTQEND